QLQQRGITHGWSSVTAPILLEPGAVLAALNRDRGASRDATPPTPPGIRVRTPAVRRVKLPPSSHGKQVVAGLSRSDDAATAYTSLSQSGPAVHATRPSKRRPMSAFRCYRRCETSVLLVLSFSPLRGPFGPSAAEAAYYALC